MKLQWETDLARVLKEQRVNSAYVCFLLSPQNYLYSRHLLPPSLQTDLFRASPHSRISHGQTEISSGVDNEGIGKLDDPS